MKTKLKWDKDFEVGVEIIDNQHKVLFDLANDLNNAVLSGASMGIIDTLFSVIKNYTFQHFETEEELFKDHQEYLQHCHQHYKLIKQFNDYTIDFHNGRAVDIPPGIFLEKWLIRHISESDQPALSASKIELSMEVDDYELDTDGPNESDKRHSKRLQHEKVIDSDIKGHCFNATKLKSSKVKIVDLSISGLKITSNRPHDIDDLLVINCNVGKNFKLNEKVRVKNIKKEFYGVEFISPSPETVQFLTELYGAVQLY